MTLARFFSHDLVDRRRPPNARTRAARRIAGADDLAALEQVRVAVLGKKGRIAELMQTLGTLPPEERKALRPVGQRAQGARQRGARGAQGRARRRGAVAAARQRARRRHAAGAARPDRRRPHPSRQPGLRRVRRDLRRHGLRRRRRSRHRDRRPQLHQAQHPARASGAPGARHVLPAAEGRRLAAACCARTRARCRSAPCWRRSRRSASSRRAASIAATATRRTRRCSTRSRASSSTRRPTWATSSGCWRNSARRFFEVDEVKMRFRASHFPFTEPSMEVDIGAEAIGKPGAMAGDPRLRHGASQRAAQLRPRSGEVSGLRLRHGPRSHGHAEVRHPRSARLLRAPICAGCTTTASPCSTCRPAAWVEVARAD